ncbi:MAG TPA: hypothetical protein VL200_00840 [Lacunisphaera sp.]|nr:hypothetical protein [Lacunisphaera sp.]
MSHELHRHLRRNATGSQQGAIGLAQGVQVNSPAAHILKGDAGGRQVFLHGLDTRDEPAEYQPFRLHAFGAGRQQGCRQLGPEEVGGGLAVLGDR